MELVDLLWVAVPAVAGATWWWWPRRAEPPAEVETPQAEPTPPIDVYSSVAAKMTVQYDALVVAPPKVTRSKLVKVTGLVGDAPIDGMGWLSPKGEFFGNGPGNHKQCAFRILDPGATELDPERDYERELEEKRYAKLIKNTYYYGWPKPRHWRLSRRQLDIIVHWHVMHERPMPEWLEQMFVGV